MGVGESSLLQSVDSLGHALDDIEKKLSTVEDLHSHNERILVHDGYVIVSGKRIACRPGVLLTVGPILGVIRQGTCRVLLEVNESVEVTLNVFLINELSSDGRLEYSKTVKTTVKIIHTLMFSLNFIFLIQIYSHTKKFAGCGNRHASGSSCLAGKHTDNNKKLAALLCAMGVCWWAFYQQCHRNT